MPEDWDLQTLCQICSLILKQKLSLWSAKNILVCFKNYFAFVTVLSHTNKGGMRENDDLSAKNKMLSEKQKVYALSLNTSFQIENKKSGSYRQIVAYLQYLNCYVSTPTISSYDINIPSDFSDFLLKL